MSKPKPRAWHIPKGNSMTPQEQLNALVQSMDGTFTPTMVSTPLFHPLAQAFDTNQDIDSSFDLVCLMSHSGRAANGSEHYMVLVKTADLVIFLEDVVEPLDDPGGLISSTYTSQGQAIAMESDTAEAQAFVDKAIDYMLACLPDSRQAFLDKLRAATALPEPTTTDSWSGPSIARPR